MEHIFETYKEPIPFKVDDMLRGKCLFADISNINQCCTDILEALKKKENQDLKVIKLDNRLNKPTSDLVLKILFGNTIAELQMAINLSAAENEFNHKIYELKRTKFFTPLTQLSIFNEDLSVDYLTEVAEVIQANIREKQKEEDYEEVTSYAEAYREFDQFVGMLPVKIDF